MSELYSLKEMVRLIAPSGDLDVQNQIMRKVRHWTNHDLVGPAGPKRTGTGVSRVYDEVGLCKACILLEVTRYGATVDMLEGFNEWADGAARSSDWQAAIKGEWPFFISVVWPEGRHAPGRWRIMDAGIFVAMEHGDDEIAGDPSLFDFSSMLLLNLTAIFAPLSA